MAEEIKKNKELENALCVIGKCIWAWFGTKCPRTAYWIGAIVTAIASVVFTTMMHTAEVPCPKVENTDMNTVEKVETQTNVVDKVESTNTIAVTENE